MQGAGGCKANHVSGSKGGPHNLIEEACRLDYKAAYQWALTWLGLDRKARDQAVDVSGFASPEPLSNFKCSFQERPKWIPIFPVPAAECRPDIEKTPSLSYLLKSQNKRVVALYPYQDGEGNLLGYTVRLEDNQGQKVVLPFHQKTMDKPGLVQDSLNQARITELLNSVRL